MWQKPKNGEWKKISSQQFLQMYDETTNIYNDIEYMPDGKSNVDSSVIEVGK